MISLHRRRVSWKWDVCVAVILGFAVSEWCFRGVESRCYIGICDAECLLRSSLLREVSCKTLVLEAWIVTFDESLVENARFGSLDYYFWWKSRVKCSFWKLGLSLLVKVSWEMLVLEAWIITFGESLVESARFGSLDCHFWWKFRGKRSFWKFGLSLLVKVSWKTLVLEVWTVTFGESLVENACFGSLGCHFGWNLVVCSRSVKQEFRARASRKSV